MTLLRGTHPLAVLLVLSRALRSVRLVLQRIAYQLAFRVRLTGEMGRDGGHADKREIAAQ